MATDLKKLRDELLAEQFGDVGPAQERAADAASRANWGRIGSQAANAFTGKRPDTAFWDGVEAQGQRGVQDAMRMGAARGAAGSEARQIAAAQAAAAKDAELDDPTNPMIAGELQLLAGDNPEMLKQLQGGKYTLRQLGRVHPIIQKRIEQQIEEQKAKAKREETLADRTDQRAYDKERDHQRHLDRREENSVLAGQRAAADAGKQPTVPAGEAAEVGELSAAEKMIDDLSTEWDKKAAAPGSGVLAKIPGTTAAQYGDNQLAKAQAIGTILEGGKLTDADLYGKYMKLVPEASDGPERKAAKIMQLRKIVQEKRAAKVKGLTQAGYKTQGFEVAPPESAPAAEGPPPPGMKWQRNVRTGERRLVPTGGQ